VTRRLILAEKRYQVFISSTFRDLLDERQKVAQVLLGMDCIPAGMELFPAIDEEQLEFIKRVIDDCDYYILILGGRYGSVTDEGISYTEKEFNYATEKGIRVIAFVHENPDSLPVDKSDIVPEARERLRVFRERVLKGRLVKPWKSSDELPGLVALSLMKTIKTYPAPGWVRQIGESNEELLREINSLRKEKESLEKELLEIRSERETESEPLASDEDTLVVAGYYWPGKGQAKRKWRTSVSWNRILYHIGPKIYHPTADAMVSSYLAKTILVLDVHQVFELAELAGDVFHTIRVQFEALNYVTIQALPLQRGGEGLFWTLTPKGKKKLFSLRLVRKDVMPTVTVAGDSQQEP
jgi:hypothetical protein